MNTPLQILAPSRNRAAVWATQFTLSLLAAASANASAITWSAPQTITDDSDVSTSGTLVVAHNFGGTGIGATTINGVTFTPFATGAASNTVGNVTLSSASTVLGANTGFGEILPPFSDLTPAYQTLLESASYTSSLPPPPTLTLTLAGLTPGAEYQFQWWANQSDPFSFDPNPAPPIFPSTTATAGGIVTLDRTGLTPGSVGQYAIGVFTANATTQVITFDGSDTKTLINGFQLRETAPVVPEPGSCLFGFALTGFLLSTASRRRARAIQSKP